MRYPNSPWPDRDAELRSLWSAKPTLSTAEIGRRMGLGKNSIVGRSHRLNLPGRISPIIRDERGPTRPDRRPIPTPPLTTLPPLISLSVAPLPIQVARKPPVIRAPIPAPQPPVARQEIGPADPYTADRSTRLCQWVMGERPVLMCSNVAPIGSPWCEGHQRLAPVKRQPRLDDEAAPAFPHPSVQLR